jgi:hypothetical protein
MRPTSLIPYLAAALLMAWVPAGHAQSNSPTPPSTSGRSAPISDQKLDAAAAALQQVVALQQEYRARLAATPEASEQERLISEANSKLTKAVTDQGLSVEEYSSIMQVAQNDSDVRGKILQRIEPAGSKSAPPDK